MRADTPHPGCAIIPNATTFVKGEGWRALRLLYAIGAPDGAGAGAGAGDRPDGAGAGAGTGIGDRRGGAGLVMDIVLPDAVASPADPSSGPFGPIPFVVP